ncbi:MAG TPA: Rne/Rng family ribonuclease [Gaiellaceae bacterium]|nr:Rne/Rng family ribonuclease [Gaiellaceae bacterium]
MQAGSAPADEPTGEARKEAPTRSRPAAKDKDREKEREKDGRSDRSRRQTSRRRQAPRRAPLPLAKRELVITVDVGEQRAAVLEDGRVAEAYLERPERRSIAGNIYLGVVDNVLPGMEAAFVEIGLEKNGFLYVDEIVVPELEGKRHGKKIQDLISRGEQLLVQAVKDPMKTKGARLTTEISLPGRFLVYVPNGEGLGVSRRLEDAERQRLKDILREIAPKEGGVIVRTAADGASAEDVERDLVFLQRLWKTIQARAKAAKAPALVYQEAELPLRIVRDLFAGDFEAAYIDHERTHKRIVGYLKKTSPHMVERVHRYKDKTPLFEVYGVDKEISSTLSRRVDLPSGGYLVFDYAEAFTVIDVNTGRFVGSRSKSSSSRLEDTITKNNLEAVKEVVRQLRLRDIGGIIVIDFIDMANPKNRASVEDALRSELERDRTKTYVVEISPLGLVEMTRQNVTDGPREILTRKCPVCNGDGIVVSDETVALEVERSLRAIAGSGSRAQAYRVAVHPRILPLLAGPAGSRLAALEEAARRRFFLVEAEGTHVHTDHVEVLAQGKLVDIEPASPVEEGAELEVKLVEVGLHDAGAGVAKLDGLDVVVAGAASLVGKKAKVRVGRVLDGTVFAALAGAKTAEGPITFESEAEKPTRAPGRAKAKPEPDAPPAEPEEVEPADGQEPEAAAEEPAEEETVASAARKKTRRGSRGGRRRSKPAAPARAAAAEPEATSGGAEAEEAPEEPTPAARPRRTRAPKIHVPEREPAAAEAPSNGRAATVAADEPDAAEAEGESAETPGDEAGEQPRKRTRRGTRGGRNRRKKTAEEAGGGAGGAVAAEDGGEPVAVVAEAADGYVPMSEWLEDLE